MKWSEKLKVRFHDTDANENVGLSNIFKYIQESAMCQVSAQHPTYKELLDVKKAFVLSNIRMEIYSQLAPFDEIEARTWACESRGLSFLRCYDIIRGGEVVCEAYSAWALVSTENRMLYKASDVDLSEYSNDVPVELEHSSRVHIPQELPLSLVGEYSVRYSDTDFNGHMNNTNYGNMITNCIPNIENLHVKSVGICFHAEAKRGETLKLYLGKTDGKYYFRSVRESDGKTNIEAEIITESN